MVVDESLQCYIIDLNTNRRIDFNIEKPESYTDNYQANFQQQDVRGGANPFQSYVNSGPRSISFSVLLALDFRRDLDSQTDTVRQMFMPYRSEGANVVKPPYVSVKIGKALSIEAIPTSFSAEWTGGYKDGVYRLCTWSFSFTEVTKNAKFNKNDNELDVKGVIPMGLEYLPVEDGEIVERPEVETPESAINVGDIVKIQEGAWVFETANEALNNSGNRSRLSNEEYLKDYYITNVKDNAYLLTDGKGGPNVGWVVMG